MSECSLERYEPHADRFYELTVLMLEYNAHTNLTAITEPEDIIVKHYADSLSAAEFIGESGTLCDVGCGAGFPSLPLAMVLPGLRVTSLDSTAKKLRFIDEAAAALGLANIETLCGRAEEIAAAPPRRKKPAVPHSNGGVMPKTSAAKASGGSGGADCGSRREKYDFVCARAVAPLRVLSEYCLPLARVGGKFFALKGADAAREIDESRAAIAALGGEIADKRETPLTLRGEILEHNVIIIQKTARTPILYPRSNAAIGKNPL